MTINYDIVEDNDILNTTDAVPLVLQDIFGVKRIEFVISTYVLSILGVPGNLVTLTVLLSSKSFRNKPINRFLIHQSFIDLFSCCFTIFEEAISEMKTMMVQPFVCHVFISRMGTGAMFYISTYNMVFLSIERYQAIMNPLKYDNEKVLRRLPFVFLFTWLINMAALSIAPATSVIQNGVCLIGWGIIQSPFLLEYYTTHCFVISFVIPITIMIFCYTKMYLALRSSVKLSAAHSLSSKVNRSSDSKTSAIHKSRLAQVNIFQTCLILATVTTICWVTNVSDLFLYMIGYYEDLSNDHTNIAWLLLIFSAVLNPYVSII